MVITIQDFDYSDQLPLSNGQ